MGIPFLDLSWFEIRGCRAIDKPRRDGYVRRDQIEVYLSSEIWSYSNGTSKIHYLMVSHGENRTWDPSQFHGERERESVCVCVCM